MPSISPPELWQLYDEQGQPIPGRGATKQDTFADGLLHGAAHIWMWRRTDHGPEVLLQKRADSKKTWPNYYDISAGGHIDVAETPLMAALRETREELGIDIGATDLYLFNVHRCRLQAGTATENEFQWLYLLELPAATRFNLETAEVAATFWQPLADFLAATSQPGKPYVPHGDLYYQTVAEAIRRAAA